MLNQVNGYLTNRNCKEQPLIFVLLRTVVGQNVLPTLDEFSTAVCNGQTVHKHEPESLQQLLFPCQPQETPTTSYQNSEPIPLFQSRVLMVPGTETFEQQQPEQQLEPAKGGSSGVDFGTIRMFPEQSGNGFNTSTSTCQSLNLISQMSESELLGIINPSTFDSV